MADTFSKSERSRIMRQVPSRGTSLEQRFQEILRDLGLRFRAQVQNLPGRPDFILPKDKIAVFVNGCFWHGHTNCGRARLPENNRRYWRQKISGNRRRDESAKRALRKLGWKTITIWECRFRDPESVRRRLSNLTRSQGGRKKLR